MKIDLHNHTTLCNHAEGSVEDYVQSAISKKVDIFGFSDHAPMDFDPAYRMSFDQIPLYFQMVREMKKKYQADIEILLGFEVDYLKGHLDKRVLDADVDYLIGSVHFINEWGFDNPEFIGRYQHEDIDEIWRKYFELVEQMAQSGTFDIVGHLDLIKVFKFMPKKDIRLLAAKALKAIKQADMVIEINMAGYRKPVAEPYPSPTLLEEIYALDIPITFGSDAHKPEQIDLFREDVEKLARSIGYTHCATFRNRDRELLTF